MRKVIAQEDDCAPDALEYFNKSMAKETGMNVEEFKAKAIKVEFKMGYEYTYREFALSWYADDPFYLLEREENNDE